MKVYIAGKITGNDHYREEFAAAEEKLRAIGYIPINPAILPKEAITAADVAPVRHGRWLLDGSCSECLANPLTTHKNYYPNCGAKMDGGADNG